jgi:hypothetical protein
LNIARRALLSKELLAEWIETYGVDSDFVRVRLRGLPPTAYELQFIDRERIKEAQEREPQSLSDERYHRAGSSGRRPQLPRRQENRSGALIESYLPDM